ncbi:alpha/beta hydrolase [Catenovulum sp. 2E275]|uniref:alpha/beta fold hydrolase n=1 Tax=Catenovulum sp. 2E275 TaxID=2980497 RepID=UPI0021D1FB01|nr:alpha/beta hydrolase [Catenovulum sp. 2E275]MCU4676541.1 alpha/beta hydrolase [Catenovulum sp. 2E275]
MRGLFQQLNTRFPKPNIFSAFLIGAACLTTTMAQAAQPQYGGELQGFEYPYPVKYYQFESQGQALKMAYLDIAPAVAPQNTASPTPTIVLMHGKNFCAATWQDSIERLTQAGFRVIAPDQIGFCKSTKPQHYQFSFHQLATNTHNLLNSLNIKNASVMGHSMGGMLATRYALMFPQQTRQLILLNPIGLEDWKAKGVPYQTLDQNYQAELNKTAKGIKNYQQHTYYVGQWRPEFDKWVDMLAGMYNGKDKQRVAWNQALTSDMVFTQPVVHEFSQLKIPTLLLIGEKDNTAIGKNNASKAVQKTLGRYDILGEQAAEKIPNATLVEFADLGHSPHIQQPDRFHQTLLQYLTRN